MVIESVRGSVKSEEEGLCSGSATLCRWASECSVPYVYVCLCMYSCVYIFGSSVHGGVLCKLERERGGRQLFVSASGNVCAIVSE